MAIDVGHVRDVAETRGPRRHVLQVVAAGLVVVAMALSLWGMPRQASEAAFGQALRDGQVVGVVPDTGQKVGADLHVGLGGWFASSRSSSAGSILWSSTDGRLYRTTLDSLATLPPVGAATSDDTAGTGTSPTVDVQRSIEATARAASVAVPDQTSLGWAGRLDLPLSVLLLGALILLVMGPQPRRFTKWGTFWLLGLPLGAGLIWWLLRDAPFDPAMRAVPEPEPHRHGPGAHGVLRRSGAVGFAWALVGSLAMTLLLVGVVDARGWGDRPDPRPGSVTFEVVYVDGQQATLTV